MGYECKITLKEPFSLRTEGKGATKDDAEEEAWQEVKMSIEQGDRWAHDSIFFTNVGTIFAAVNKSLWNINCKFIE